jgi:hypothetical protein
MLIRLVEVESSRCDDLGGRPQGPAQPAWKKPTPFRRNLKTTNIQWRMGGKLEHCNPVANLLQRRCIDAAIVALFFGQRGLRFGGVRRTMDDTTFWKQVRQRRNLFFLCWVGWLPVGGMVIGLYSLIFGHEAPDSVGFSLFYFYGAIWFWTAIRLKLLRCPRCHKRAIAHPFFFMQDAKCKCCGLTNQHANKLSEPR